MSTACENVSSNPYDRIGWRRHMKAGGQIKQSLARKYRGRGATGSGCPKSIYFAVREIQLHPVCHCRGWLLLDHPVGGHSATTINYDIQQTLFISQQ